MRPSQTRDMRSSQPPQGPTSILIGALTPTPNPPALMIPRAICQPRWRRSSALKAQTFLWSVHARPQESIFWVWPGLRFPWLLLVAPFLLVLLFLLRAA